MYVILEAEDWKQISEPEIQTQTYYTKWGVRVRESETMKIVENYIGESSVAIIMIVFGSMSLPLLRPFIFDIYDKQRHSS